MESFNRNGLQFVRLEGSSAKGKREGVVKRFQEDPDVAAFFLHTRSQSAGLTLTCARYVSSLGYSFRLYRPLHFAHGLAYYL